MTLALVAYILLAFARDRFPCGTNVDTQQIVHAEFERLFCTYERLDKIRSSVTKWQCGSPEKSAGV